MEAVMKQSLWAVLGLLTMGTAQAAVVGEEVGYSAGDVTMQGYLAYDDAIEGPRPGVLVVHEWWGHNDHARERARMLAELGYTALAVDMYGDGRTADHPDQAGEFAGAVMGNIDTARARFLAAMETLQNHPTVDGEHLAAIGFCFGGGVVLHMARMGVDGLDGVASFHGSLGTRMPAEAGAVDARILVLHGADDPLVPEEQVAAFKAEMDNAGADYTFIAYPGATHGFTNPEADANAERFGLPLGYNAEVDQQSWAELESFLSELFQG
jgi:dienelactone hydrolase